MSKEFTLDNFIKFLEKKPADGTYAYASPGHCAASQFASEIGHEYRVPSIEENSERGRIERAAHISEGHLESPHTFGGALKTARTIKEYA